MNAKLTAEIESGAFHEIPPSQVPHLNNFAIAINKIGKSATRAEVAEYAKAIGFTAYVGGNHVAIHFKNQSGGNAIAAMGPRVAVVKMNDNSEWRE